MRKFFLFLVTMLAVFYGSAGFAETNSKEYQVGIDIPAGEYTVELYQKEDNEFDIGVAICFIIRQEKGTYKIETISTDDMTLTEDNPTCELTLYEDDRLGISYGGDSYDVRLISHTSDGFIDQYPGAIEGVNLTQAFNRTIAFMTSDSVKDERFPGLRDVEFEYDSTLPSINITFFFDDRDNVDVEMVIFRTMVILDIACNDQNPAIALPTVYDYGGIYDNLCVIVGIYDESVLFGGTMDTYYVMPNSTAIRTFYTK